MDLPLVSICCTTYNHEKYIKDALEGFLNQKTDFKFEILIHDDASTDNTAAIIRKYERKYPELIKPIYQVENQYSKGIKLLQTYLYPRAKGKYIAICEGDDYWIDPYKLQKQVEYMENHSDCTFCFTNGKIVDASGKKSERLFIPYSKENEPYYYNKNRAYNVGELALLGFIPTATFIFPKRILNSLPDFYLRKYPVGDLKLKLYAASKGYAYFINDITSVYRENVENSVTTKWRHYNREQLVKLKQGFIDLLEAINVYTDFKYSKELDELKTRFEFEKLVALADRQVMKDEKYRTIFKQMNIKEKISTIGAVYFPNLYTLVKMIKSKYQ